MKKSERKRLILSLTLSARTISQCQLLSSRLATRERENDDQIEKEEKKSKNLVALGASNLINTASSLAGIKDWKLNLKD